MNLSIIINLSYQLISIWYAYRIDIKKGDKNGKGKRISKCFRKDGTKEENELYLEYDRKIKEKIKEINVKYNSCINTYINDLEIRNIFKKEYEFKDDIKPYVDFLETLYVLKVLVKVNSFCLQEKTIKTG